VVASLAPQFDILLRELDLWQQDGATATFWWRDDDAAAWTPRLEDMLGVAAGCPISLAVIPASAEPSLVKGLEAYAGVTVFQHGWRHANHLTESGGASEYPPHRPAAEVEAEFAAGRALLRGYFADRYLPVFAPPFHGFSESFLTGLAAQGLTGISCLGHGRLWDGRSGLRELNVQVSLFDWKAGEFGDPAGYVAGVTEHLRLRREGHLDRFEATGILTHHLRQDAPSYDFIRTLFAVTGGHPAATWLGARDLLGEMLNTAA
jgi:hypothetical protein